MSEKRITEENRYAGLALAEEELVARVAWCYYHDGLTQNDIGERLGLPRLKISRLLEKGRQSGVIRVQINSRYEGCLALESELQQRFGLKIARVLPALNTPPMNTRLGIGAAQSLMGILQPGQLLAVGDILGYFLQADGRPVEGLEIHRELLGVTLDELAQLPTIVGVAGGEEKAQAIYAALIGKRINGLVTEETTARAVLALAS